MTKKLIIILILAGLFLTSFNLIVQAQEGDGVQLPENTEQVKEAAGNVLKTVKQEMPGNMKNLWQEQVLPVWQSMYDWFKVNIWVKVRPKAQEEIQKRRPGAEEEMQKKTGETKEELKKDIPQISQDIRNLWQKLKDLIK
jgi:hypothetical protein